MDEIRDRLGGVLVSAALVRLVCTSSRPSGISSVMDDEYVLRPWCEDVAVLRWLVVSYDAEAVPSRRHSISGDVSEVVDRRSPALTPTATTNLVVLAMGDELVHCTMLVAARLSAVEGRLMVGGSFDSLVITRATWTYVDLEVLL